MNMAYCMLHHEGNGNACLKDKLIFMLEVHLKYSEYMIHYDHTGEKELLCSPGRFAISLIWSCCLEVANILHISLYLIIVCRF